jgi:trimeric autotransporter adhesin
MRPNRRRSAALALLACGLVLAVLAPCASARPATGGAGRFGGAIDWVEWGANNDVLDVSAPITKTSTTNFSGHQLVVSCTISNFARVGGGAITLKAYRSGNWSGDALDDLYNIGGVQSANTLINGLSVSGMDLSFDFACSATVDSSPYALAGLVFADGEQSGSVEYVAGTISTSATWRLIDRFRTAGCANDAQVTRTVVGASQTLRLDNPPSTLCGAGPAGVAVADGATSGRIAVRGGGTSAVALGAVVTFDDGDAPASYGDALHAAPYSFSGGVPATGSSALFAGNTVATTTQPALRLGASVDPEGTVFSATANGDDINPTGAFGPGDDETEAPPATISVDRGATFTHTVACTGSGCWLGGSIGTPTGPSTRASAPATQPALAAPHRSPGPSRPTASRRRAASCACAYVSHPGAKLRNGQACWTIPALAPHTTRSFTVTARVLAGQSQSLVNVAHLDGANVKPARDTAGLQRALGEHRAGGVTG